MATPFLTSRSLYRVPGLASALTNLSFTPDAPGFERLRAHQYGAGHRVTPNIRSVQKMLHANNHLKYDTCLQIVKTVEQYAAKIVHPVPIVLEIEEHEYIISNIEKAIDSIKTRRKCNRRGAIIIIAEACEKPASLVSAMASGHRTTQARCELIVKKCSEIINDADAVLKLGLRINVPPLRHKIGAVPAQSELFGDD